MHVFITREKNKLDSRSALIQFCFSLVAINTDRTGLHSVLLRLHIIYDKNNNNNKTTKQRTRTKSTKYAIQLTQGPHSQILMTVGVRQRFIFYTQKNHNFRICLPKKITTFFSIPQKIPPLFFRDPKKIPE